VSTIEFIRFIRPIAVHQKEKRREALAFVHTWRERERERGKHSVVSCMAKSVLRCFSFLRFVSSFPGYFFRYSARSFSGFIVRIPIVVGVFILYESGLLRSFFCHFRVTLIIISFAFPRYFAMRKSYRGLQSIQFIKHTVYKRVGEKGSLLAASCLQGSSRA
jgi:hypothetical protein